MARVAAAAKAAMDAACAENDKKEGRPVRIDAEEQ